MATPSLSVREGFSSTVFQQHLERWQRLMSTVGSIVIEGSPWGYLLQTGYALDAAKK